MKHKKVSKKSVNSTTGKSGVNSDQISSSGSHGFGILSDGGHVSRKLGNKKGDYDGSMDSRSNSGSSRSNSMDSSHSNDSNIDCESMGEGKSEDEEDAENSFSQSLKEKESNEDADEMLEMSKKAKSSFQSVLPTNNKNNEFSSFNFGLQPNPSELNQFLHFQSTFSSQQLKLLNQFYHDLRSGNQVNPDLFKLAASSSLQNFAYLNETNQVNSDNKPANE